MNDAATSPEPGVIACPRCASPIGRDQDWCLVCGAAARTRLARAPNWKLPIAVLASVVALSLVALALAFVALTDDPERTTGTTGTTGASGPTAVAPIPVPTAPTGPTGTSAPPSGAAGPTTPRSAPTGPSGAAGVRPESGGRRGTTRTPGGAG